MLMTFRTFQIFVFSGQLIVGLFVLKRSGRKRLVRMTRFAVLVKLALVAIFMAARTGFGRLFKIITWVATLAVQLLMSAFQHVIWFFMLECYPIKAILYMTFRTIVNRFALVLIGMTGVTGRRFTFVNLVGMAFLAGHVNVFLFYLKSRLPIMVEY